MGADKFLIGDDVYFPSMSQRPMFGVVVGKEDGELLIDSSEMGYIVRRHPAECDESAD